MKFLIGIPLIILAIGAITALVVLLFVFRFLRTIHKNLRGNFTDEEVERLSKKYRREQSTYNFDKDYFKRSEHSRADGSEPETERMGRTTQTASGVTIIDDRDRNKAERKIFTKDEGEYVEYTEE